MALVKAKCPNCGKIIDIEAEDFNVTCRFCGVPFMPKEGIDSYNKHLSELVNNINVDTLNVNADNITNYATLGLACLEEKNHEKCGFYADDILKRKPNSPEGLLLKAFFVSNNYSKEEGIRYYFLAYNNATEEKLKQKILNTLKDEFTEYSLENFEFLLDQMCTPSQNAPKELFYEVLCFLSSGMDEIPFIEQINLSYSRFTKFIQEDFVKQWKDQYEFYQYKNTLVVCEGETIKLVIYFNEVDHECEKYVEKKTNKVTYNFYLTHRILVLTMNHSSDELEASLKEFGISIDLMKKGCYVATCVYGSYQHPSVWTLRRYRDDYLSKHILGRAFIKLYYKVSPTIVCLFGNQKWFHKLNRMILDHKVCKLQNKGYLNTPYRDKKY